MTRTVRTRVCLHPEELVFTRQVSVRFGRGSVTAGLRIALDFYAEQKHLDPATGLPLAGISTPHKGAQK